MVGRSERTIRAWLHDVEGFREAAEGTAAEIPELSSRATLRLALSATRADGSPDWSIRVAAAKALIAAGEPAQAPVVSIPPGGVGFYPKAVDVPIPLAQSEQRGLRWTVDGGEGGVLYGTDSLEEAQGGARELRGGRIPAAAGTPIVDVTPTERSL